MGAVWVDAQLSPSLAAWLTATFACEALALRNLDLRDAEDTRIFELARAVSAVVITRDRDFVDLLSRHGPPPQIVWLTCGNTSSSRTRGRAYKHCWPLANR